MTYVLICGCMVLIGMLSVLAVWSSNRLDDACLAIQELDRDLSCAEEAVEYLQRQVLQLTAPVEIPTSIRTLTDEEVAECEKFQSL